MRLLLGARAWCVDGPFGELIDVVIDPHTCSVTHLVIEPHHRHWMARLVAIELAGLRQPGERLLLRCSIAEAQRLEHVQRSAFLPLGGEFEADDPDWDVGLDGVVLLPYYGSDAAPAHDALQTAVYDRIPKGEVEIRHSSVVISGDGHRLGHVAGFVLDDGRRIMHVLLEHRHLRGRRDVMIPIVDVSEIKPDEITLHLTRDAVGRLEAVDIRHR